jgi:ATP-binding cassette, subfamily F, member 3
LLLGPKNANASVRDSVTSSRRDERRAAAERRRELESLRKRVRSAETRMGALTKELETIESALADPATYGGTNPNVPDLLRQQGELRAALETAERDWLAAAEALEKTG